MKKKLNLVFVICLIATLNITCAGKNKLVNRLNTTENLLVYIDFDNSSQLNDKSLYKNKIENDNIIFETGVSGKCAKFNGDNSSVIIKNSSVINSTTDEITISLWFKAESFYLGQNNVNSLIRKNINEGKENYFIRFRIIDKIPHIEFSLGAHKDYIRCSYEVDISKWYHIVGVYRNNELLVYLNGNIIGRKKTSVKIFCDDSDIYIGKGDVNYSNGEYFQGLIDEIKIYNIGLSDKEIINEYKMYKK